jgi:hypothetical protein
VRRRYTAVLYQVTETVAVALADAGIETSPWPAAAAALAVATDPVAASLLGPPADPDPNVRI